MDRFWVVKGPNQMKTSKYTSSDNNVLIRSGEAPAIGWSRNVLHSGFNILPRSVFWSANFNGRSDNLDVIRLMNDSENPYLPPSTGSSPSGVGAEPDIAHILFVPFSVAMISFIVGVPIFVCLTMSWIFASASKVFHFNFFVLPEYNPLVAFAITVTILLLFAVIRIAGYNSSDQLWNG